MSKKAKKKKKKAEFPTKEEKAQKKKAERILMIVLLCEIVFGFIYLMINRLYVEKTHSDAVIIFREIKAEAYIIYCIIMMLFIAGMLFSKKSKNITGQKIIPLALAGIIGICVCFILNCQIWSADEDGLHYNTLFAKDKIVYSYDDIECAELYDSHPVRGESTLVYEIKTESKETVLLYLSNAEYKSTEDVIKFDSELLKNRAVQGKYSRLYAYDKKLDEYYKSVFAKE